VKDAKTGEYLYLDALRFDKDALTRDADDCTESCCGCGGFVVLRGNKVFLFARRSYCKNGAISFAEAGHPLTQNTSPGRQMPHYPKAQVASRTAIYASATQRSKSPAEY
jgi:hypothetical protein